MGYNFTSVLGLQDGAAVGGLEMVSSENNMLHSGKQSSAKTSLCSGMELWRGFFPSGEKPVHCPEGLNGNMFSPKPSISNSHS